MGVDFSAVAGYGFVMTYKEAAKLARELNLLDYDEKGYTDQEVYDTLDEIFEREDTSSHSDYYEVNHPDKKIVIIDATTSVNVDPGEVAPLKTNHTVDNKIITGIAERLDKKPDWIMYAYMW